MTPRLIALFVVQLLLTCLLMTSPASAQALIAPAITPCAQACTEFAGSSVSAGHQETRPLAGESPAGFDGSSEHSSLGQDGGNLEGPELALDSVNVPLPGRSLGCWHAQASPQLPAPSLAGLQRPPQTALL